MTKFFQILCCLSLLLLNACSDDKQENSAHEASGDSQILKSQIQALEKAKGVEQVIQDRADQSRQTIDE